MTKKNPGPEIYKLSERWSSFSGLSAKRHKPTPSQIEAERNYWDGVLNSSTKQQAQIGIETYGKALIKNVKDIIEHERGVKNVELKKEQKEFIGNYIKWFFGDGGALDPSKSIYLVGPLGTGKSTIAKAISKLSRRLFDLGFAKPENDFYNLGDFYMTLMESKSINVQKLLKRRLIILDELREDQFRFKHYGNECNWVNSVLDSRFRFWEELKVQTMITTNITPSDLREVMNDERLFNRIQLQYSIYYLKGNNLRNEI